MAQHLNRRDWLKGMALLAGGLALGTDAQAHDAGFQPYIRRRNANPGPVNLGSNENPYGPSDIACKAVLENLKVANRYPRHLLRQLREALATKEGVATEQLLLGAGSSELLGVLGSRYGSKGGNFVAPYPTFSLMMTYAEVHGVQWNKVPVGADFGLDLPAMLRAINADTKLVFVCNPNNPTGTLLPWQQVEAFIHEVAPKLPVVVDEAYFELIAGDAHRSMTYLIEKYPNLIVLRTFSKIYGLAGMRIGYALAQAATIQQLMKHQMGPGISVSAAGAAAATASLQDQGFVEMSRKYIAAARDYTHQQLAQLELQPVPSHTNFCIFPISNFKGDFKAEVLRRGYIVQSWDIANKPYCRVSYGTIQEMQGFVAALKEMLA